MITVEEGAAGGFGAQVMNLIAENGAFEQRGFQMRSMTLPDQFIDHDTPAAMYARAGLDAKAIAAKVLGLFDARPAPELDAFEITRLTERAKERRVLRVNERMNGAAE
jgi:deoxyxylulose-5-phosphate synthase